MNEEILNTISELVERFARNEGVYKNPKYKEAQLRREFIDPFFSALGWDMDNKQGHAEQYKDIVHEDAIKITGTTKAPDYSFRIGGVRKFFVEAKKPAIDIKYDIHPSFQLRRYAWSAKLPISILTDFEEFSVYDCRIKPNKNDKSSVGRIYYQTFDHYLEDLDFLYNTFSREAILKGSFDKYTETATKKRGTSEVDQEFLKEIENWRDVLAKNIALRNKELSIYELNRIVQLTIDRIIFLRIAEDRGVEEYRNLFNVANKKNIYKALFAVFVQADEKYNSGIFDFKNNLISRNILLDDKVLKPILQKLYYPDSPYEFSVLPSDILGNIYEQFLGKTIRLTPSHQAKIEEKPEVRKAGGVYYTPRYIVNYIVKNTVGEKIKGKTPTQISKLTICDPACGSGSFLIQAYQYLLDYHLEFYQTNPKKYKDKIIEIGHKSYQLTTKEKKRILLNNIYGVDIDPQAVEVTKLSLLLKVLKGENRETLDKTRQLFHERALPNLSDNIKCGNSLIGTDFYDVEDMSLFENENMRRINAFDWDKEFPQIFKTNTNKIPLKKGGKLSEEKLGDVTANGGFDVVIGNPPYSLQISQEEKKYFRNTLKNLHFKINLFACFIEKSMIILKKRGFFSFIVPNLLFANDSLSKLRKLMLEEFSIGQLINCGDGVFEKVSMPTMVFIITKQKNKSRKVEVITNVKLPDLNSGMKFKVLQDDFLSNYNFIFDTSSPEIKNLIEKISSKSINLKEILEINQGIITGNDKKYLSEEQIDKNYKLTIRGKNIERYYTGYQELYVNYERKLLACPRNESLFNVKEKLLMRRTGDKPIASCDYKRTFNLHTLYSCRLKKGNEVSIKYMLGLINSRLFKFVYQKRLGTEVGRTFAEIKIVYIRRLPVRTIDFSNISEKQIHDTLVTLVDKMIETQKLYHSAKLERDKKLYKQKIDIIDNKIDKIVYDLYGLTDEEIGIIEESFK